MKKFDFQDLKQACAGNWASIVGALSRVDISEAIQQKHKKRHIHCYLGHSKEKKFRVFENFDETGGGICTCATSADGFALLGYLNGWDNSTAVREVAKYMKDRGYKPEHASRKPTPVPKKEFTVNKSSIESLQKVWAAAVPLKGTLGEKYFRDRGIDGELPTTNDIRFHAGLHYWDEETEQSLGYFPAIVSLIRSSKSGHPLSIHRIYLDPVKGKAKVPRPKKLMSCSIDGAISELGGAIRLYKLNGFSMGITEGVETAAAVHASHPGLPVWAAYSASVLTNFRPPYGIKLVHIFGDLDTSGTGQVASVRLALRLEKEKIKVRICLPKSEIYLPGEDSHWYTTEATKQAVTERVTRESYKVVDTCPDLDWLDVANASRQTLVDALKRPVVR